MINNECERAEWCDDGYDCDACVAYNTVSFIEFIGEYVVEDSDKSVDVLPHLDAPQVIIDKLLTGWTMLDHFESCTCTICVDMRSIYSKLRVGFNVLHCKEPIAELLLSTRDIELIKLACIRHITEDEMECAGRNIHTSEDSLRIESLRKEGDLQVSQKTKPLFIYLMKNHRNGYTKIGRSNQPQVREKTLQSEEPEVSLLHYWEGTPSDERDLHAQYKDKRLRGEWFDLTDADISSILAQFSNITTV